MKGSASLIQNGGIVLPDSVRCPGEPEARIRKHSSAVESKIGKGPTTAQSMRFGDMHWSSRLLFMASFDPGSWAHPDQDEGWMLIERKFAESTYMGGRHQAERMDGCVAVPIRFYISSSCAIVRITSRESLRFSADPASSGRSRSSCSLFLVR